MAFAGTTPEGRRIFTVNLKTLEISPVTDRDSSGEIVAAKRRELLYFNGTEVYATHLDTRQTRKITELDPAWPRGGHLAVNADETLLMGFFAEGIAEYFKKPRSEWFIEIHKARLPNALYTIDIRTGETKIIHRENNWLGHVQFSPTDPKLVSFCHEGPWNLVDRIWTIRADGTDRQLVHRRTMENEIAGHEFWGSDGKRIWFDLQMPMGENFFLANVTLVDGKLTRYRLERDQWCIHYNISADGSMCCGDGGASSSVARAEDGKWIYLFRPRGEQLEVERLCGMADHDYRTEPNVRFTPDGRWVVFNSNINDSRQIHAVEVARAFPTTAKHGQ